jgi:hypothetical protein
MASPTPDRIGGAIWIALGVAVLAGAWQMDRYQSMGGSVHTAPGLVPGIYGLLMIVLGATLALRRPRSGGVDPVPLLSSRIGLALVLTLAYAAGLVGRAPFGVATAVFVAAFCWVFDSDSPIKTRATSALLAGIGTAVVVVLVFERVFLVRLP